MPITKKSGRQEVIAATADFTYADVTDDTYMPAVDLPGGAIVVGGHLAITTIFNSGTDDKFSIGDKVGAASAAKETYAALSADITAAGAVPIVPTGKKYSEPSTVVRPSKALALKPTSTERPLDRSKPPLAVEISSKDDTGVTAVEY